jgi:hypothetical protein
MGKNTEFNRASGPINRTAMEAASALAVILPETPPIPALPSWPLSPRAFRWCVAVLAAAASTPSVSAEAEAWRAALRGAIEAWQALIRDHKRLPPMMEYEARSFFSAVPTEGDKADLEGCIAAAVSAGTLTPSQAAHWRVRLGLPDPRPSDAGRA